ncbi:hypothetical protein [Sediminibacillus halophilus]|uniref:Uncharacterized protein n=1 Tax=Sediminibacillus halophilus TaxID=482461 RepID=A0A1G9NC58_9BACI|nr:hypothetical protein [Sediminibacillus halophilus]SDL83963.1 hypothetical protein SAMN05216244_0933 [Sediminibacillus halophilus]
MISGFLVLVCLCMCEIIIAKLVVKDKTAFLMDFQSFFDWPDTNEEKGSSKKLKE